MSAEALVPLDARLECLRIAERVVGDDVTGQDALDALLDYAGQLESWCAQPLAPCEEAEGEADDDQTGSTIETDGWQRVESAKR